MNPLPFKWKTHLYPATAILAGLVTSQVIATFQVFFANRSLYHTLTAMGAAGYVTVPNHQTMDHFLELTTAVCGGLFLTLSAGAGISVLSFAATWLWDRVCRRKTLPLVPLLLLWAGLATGVNWNGFSPFASLYFFVIPPVVFAWGLGWMPHPNPQINKNRSRRNGLFHLIPIIVLGLLWAPQIKKGLFINIRDYLLLSNPVGERIVDFYYQYTLYPAEVLKPLEQKLLKTCSLKSGGEESPYGKQLRKNLSDHGWIEIENLENADLMLKISGSKLLMDDRRGTVLKIPANEFVSRPAGTLKRFSSLKDRYRFFRQFTFYSLLIAFPVTLYIFFYSFFFFLMGRWLAPGIAAWVSTTLCFASALILLMPLWQNNEQPTIPKNLCKALETDNRKERLRALKSITEEHLDIFKFSEYKTILTSPDTAERYWLAKALGVSRSNETYEDLLGLLKTPSPVVVSATLFALGQRGEKNAIPIILRCIKTSEHWYVQWYAYKALMTLGWAQKSKETSGLVKDFSRDDNFSIKAR
ncbi:MAG: HEAT repeat domain-containing protein [Deltaproteobacteria bacterium]|nr:HEAT repeat domain-containing protein [Deltaproteobacteria bacterium]